MNGDKIDELARRLSKPDDEPPLECGYCWTPRWNDESVVWLPLRGDYRHPYCAGTCSRWVMRPNTSRMPWWKRLAYRLRPLSDPLEGEKP